MPKHCPLVAVVEDDPVLLDILTRSLGRRGLDIAAFPDAEAFLAALEGGASPEVAVVDVRLPGEDGLAVLRRLTADVPTCRVVMMTAYRSYESLLDALRGGAVEFLMKPVSPTEVWEAVMRALERRRSSDRVEESPPGFVTAEHSAELAVWMGDSPAVVALAGLVRKAACSEVPVLITGETGTGKELVARAIHGSGPRAGRTLVAVNCAAIPEGLVESELFGHLRGSFTGAGEDRAGLIESADGSTLFLDEVGDLPATSQVKLLRVLQDRQVRRIGARSARSVDVRVIAATNRDLEAEVAVNRFRRDLYYRLGVLRIRVPPLRERRSDIPFLVGRFLELYARSEAQGPPTFAPRAYRALQRYSWPGNVRELENEVARAVTLAEGGIIDLSDLSPEVRAAQALQKQGGLRSALEQEERRMILAVLEQTGWNKTEAALRLGMSRQNLYQRMAHHRIPRTSVGGAPEDVKED
jgi:two-component system response regulator PilR (NtrC family)